VIGKVVTLQRASHLASEKKIKLIVESINQFKCHPQPWTTMDNHGQPWTTTREKKHAIFKKIAQFI